MYGKIKDTLKENFGQVIDGVGEITTCSNRNGHIWMTLRDKDSSIPAVMWKSTAEKMPEIGCGEQINFRGKVDLFVPFGKYQIVLFNVEKLGEGDKTQKFEALKKHFRINFLETYICAESNVSVLNT